MKTLIEWQTGLHGNMTQYVQPFDEIDCDLYWYFMEILPPYYTSSGFYCSEPYSTCHKYNTATYAHFSKIGGKYYFLGDISPKAHDEQYGLLEASLA